MAGCMPKCRMAGRIIEGRLSDINSKIRLANKACERNDEKSWRIETKKVLDLINKALRDVYRRFGRKGYRDVQVVILRNSRKETIADLAS